MKNINLMTDDELIATLPKSIFIGDVECYSNFFCVSFKCARTEKIVIFRMFESESLNVNKLNWFMNRFTVVGFNFINYDKRMIALSLTGADCGKLKEASDFIVKRDFRDKLSDRGFEKEYEIKLLDYDIIDLFNVCPVNGGLTENPASLKLYAGRLHAPRMQDLPYPEDKILTREEADEVVFYNINDLDNTHLLFNELASEINLRIEMSKEYKTDLRSKSDAQIAEAVINSELSKVLGYYPKSPGLKIKTVRYEKPDFICFQSEELTKIANQISNMEFQLDSMGSPVWPGDEALTVKIGKTVYKLGMGGLHSQESGVAHFATDDIILADNDVESFYPRTILNQNLFPYHLGRAFIEVYEKIVNTRIEAKSKAKECKTAGDKDGAVKYKKIADSLKIVINGSFGKLGNRYSAFYAPQLMLQVTITGQLVLLMLIEALESMGVEVISGNTDGIVSKYHKSKHDDVRKLISLWESHTNYKTEETFYKAVLSRDVNNYIAIKSEGGDPESKFFDERVGCKTKGCFSERGSALNSILSKNPENLVCIDAVLNFLVNDVPLKETLLNCKDFRRFCSIRSVKGGAVKNGEYLGKVVRWYYAKGEKNPINYKSTGNKVPKTDGAIPAMDLPKTFPDDIDYKKYYQDCIEMLYDCGRYRKIENESLF